jgi:hypothetical protein
LYSQILQYSSLAIISIRHSNNRQTSTETDSIQKGEKIDITLVFDDMADSELGASCYTGPSELISETTRQKRKQNKLTA